MGIRVALSYGLSVQGWGSWLADKAKMFALEWVIGGLLVMLVFWVIRRSPARWWFWFWIPAVAVRGGRSLCYAVRHRSDLQPV